FLQTGGEYLRIAAGADRAAQAVAGFRFVQVGRQVERFRHMCSDRSAAAPGPKEERANRNLSINGTQGDTPLHTVTGAHFAGRRRHSAEEQTLAVGEPVDDPAPGCAKFVGKERLDGAGGKTRHKPPPEILRRAETSES